MPPQLPSDFVLDGALPEDFVLDGALLTTPEAFPISIPPQSVVAESSSTDVDIPQPSSIQDLLNNPLKLSQLAERGDPITAGVIPDNSALGILKNELISGKQSLADVAAGVASFDLAIVDAANALTLVLEDKFGIPRGGAFEVMSKFLTENEKFFNERGIDPTQGGLMAFAHAMNRGLGELGAALPLISKMGLTAFSGAIGGAEALTEGKSVLAGTAKGLATGKLLGLSLGAIAPLPVLARGAAGGAIFGIPSAAETLMQPKEQRDASRVAANTMIGIMLALPGSANLRTKKDVDKLRDKVSKQIDSETKQGIPFQRAIENAQEQLQLPFVEDGNIRPSTVAEARPQIQRAANKTNFEVGTTPNIVVPPEQQRSPSQRTSVTRKPSPPVVDPVMEVAQEPAPVLGETPTVIREGKVLTVEGARMKIGLEAQEQLAKIAKEHETQAHGWDATDAMSFGIADFEVRAFAEQFGQGKATAILTKGIQNVTNAAAVNGELVKGLNQARQAGTLSDADIIGFQRGLSDALVTTFSPIREISAEAGRMLQKHQKETIPLIRGLEKLAKLSPDNRAEWERNIEAFARIDPNNPRQFAAMLRSLEKPTFKDYTYEFFYNSILSGPPTHIVNTVSNLNWQIWQTPFRAVRSIVDRPISKLQGRQREFYLREIGPMWGGYKRGFKEALPKTLELLRTGQLADDLTKWNVDIGGAGGAFERSPSKLARGLAPVVTIPTRLLRAEDVLFRGIAFEAEKGAMARRIAIKEGLSGERLIIREAELLMNPTDEMMVAAGKFGDHSIFTDDPGKLTSGIMKVRDAAPGARFVMPFVRTLSNLLKRGAELTPGLGVAVQRKSLKGPELSTVITNQILGTGIATYFATKYLDGELTGAVPQRKEQREAFYRQGKLPFAMKIGNHWISYNRIEPFNLPISTIAIMGDNWVNKGEVPTSEKLAKITNALGRNLMDQSYLNGIADLTSIINRGEQGGESLTRFIQRFPSAFVPYSSFLRSTTRAAESAITGEAILRQPKSVIEGIKANIPIVNQSVPSRKNVFGQDIVLEGGPLRQFLPYKAATETNDPVEIALQQLKIFPGMPAKKIKNVELTPEEYDEYLTISGTRIYNSLKARITAGDWGDLTEKAQDRFIRITIERQRKIVRNELFNR